MNRRKKWIAAILAVSVIVGCLLLVSRPREPRHEGKSLTYWAARLNQPEAQRALTAMGTNALPFLIEWLDEEPTRFDAWMWRVGQRLPDSLRPNSWPLGSRQDIAAHALGFLGTNAITAIPNLIRMFDWKWAGGAPPTGLLALSEIGPAAIPALMEALEEDPERGYYVVVMLAYMSEPHWQGPRSKQDLLKIVAASNELSDHPDPVVRVHLVRRLLWLDQEDIHEEVVGVWAKLLRDEDAEVRAAAVGAADYFPPDSPQMDSILPLLEDPDASVRAEVERVLQKAGRLGPLSETAITSENP